MYVTKLSDFSEISCDILFFTNRNLKDHSTNSISGKAGTISKMQQELFNTHRHFVVFID